MVQAWRRPLNTILGGALCLFTVLEVNYPRLTPQAQLGIFAMLGPQLGQALGWA